MPLTPHLKAQTRSQTSLSDWLVICRTDHPHVEGNYWYAIAASDKRLWTPGETLLATYRDGELVELEAAAEPGAAPLDLDNGATRMAREVRAAFTGCPSCGFQPRATVEASHAPDCEAVNE